MVWLIVSQVLSVLALFLWVLMISAFGLGSMSGSTDRWRQYVFYVLLVYPLILIVSIVIAWVSFRQQKLQLANLVTSAPLVYVVLVVLFIVLVAK